MAKNKIRLPSVFDGLTRSEPKRIFDLQFSQSGKQLVIAGGFDGSLGGKSVKRRNVAYLNTSDWSEIWGVEETSKRPLMSVALLEACGRVVSTSQLGEASIRDLATGQVVIALPEHYMVNLARCGPDHFLACGSFQGRHWVALYESHTGTQSGEWVIAQGGYNNPQAVISNDSGDLACVLISVAGAKTMTGEIALLSVPQLSPLAVITVPFSPIRAALIPVANRLVVLGRHPNRRDHVLALVDITSAKLVAEVLLRKSEPMRIAYAEWLDKVVLLRKDTVVEFREPQTLELAATSAPLLEGDHGGFGLAIHSNGLVAMGDFGSMFAGGGFVVHSLPASV